MLVYGTYLLLLVWKISQIDLIVYFSEFNILLKSLQDLKAQFETSLSEGSVLLITYCDVIKLAKDYRFREVFRSRPKFHSSNSPFKIMVRNKTNT